MSVEIHNNYAQLVGEYILLFGNLETCIHASIVLICNECFGKDEKLKCLINKILTMTPGIHKKYEILMQLVQLLELSYEEKKEWDTWKDSIEKLIRKRNIYAHGMYGIEDNLTKVTDKRDLRNTRIEKVISEREIENDILELQERYRQLFDSVLEKNCHWIAKYPRLKYSLLRE